MSGRQLAAALAAIVLLAVVLPPLAASRVHQRRISRAQAEIQSIAHAGVTDSRLAATPGAGPAVLIGAGDAPRWADRDWPDPRAVAGGALGADPWGNGYLVVIDPHPGTRVRVLSAGPNGIVETSWAAVRGAVVTAGDDLAASSQREEAR